MEKYKRIFVVVMDSLGVGAMEDSPEFGDVDVNTLGHISRSRGQFCYPQSSEDGHGKSDTVKAGGTGGEQPGILWKAPGEKQREGYHDRTTGR